MPITIAEFHTAAEESVRDLMRQLHKFLGKERDSAYSRSELERSLGIGGDPGSQAAFNEALRALDGLGAIRWGLVDGTDYYIYNQNLADL